MQKHINMTQGTIPMGSCRAYMICKQWIFKHWNMVYLNFTNLDSETQERLLSSSKEDVEFRSGTELRQFAEIHDKDYEALLGLPWAESKGSDAKSIPLWFCI